MALFNLKGGGVTTEEPPMEKIHTVTLSREEYLAGLSALTQLKAPWIRNANRDRDLSPHRSHPGYRLISVGIHERSGKRGYRIEAETPYRADSFDFAAVEAMVGQDSDRLCTAFGYNRVVPGKGPGASDERTLYDIQVSCDVRYEYYRIRALASAPPACKIGKAW